MWELLKSAIMGVIKTNGNRSITGQVLQDELIRVVDELGGYSYYAGVATTTLNPGTPDGSIFYFARGAGTYTNFGITIADTALHVFVFTVNGWRDDVIANAPTESAPHVPKYAEVYLPNPELLTDIQPGVPQSPSTYADNPNVAPVGWEYVGGQLRYKVDQPAALLEVSCRFSIESSKDNVVADFTLARNGALSPIHTQSRKIQNKDDVGFADVGGFFIVEPGDVFDFYIGVDTAATTVTVKSSNVTFKTFADHV